MHRHRNAADRRAGDENDPRTGRHGQRGKRPDGERCYGHRRGRHDRLRRHAGPGKRQGRHRPLRDGKRDGDGGQRLHGQERHAELLRQRDQQDRLGRDPQRRRRRERRDADAHTEQRRERRYRGRQRDGNDQRRRRRVEHDADRELRQRAGRARRRDVVQLQRRLHDRRGDRLRLDARRRLLSHAGRRDRGTPRQRTKRPLGDHGRAGRRRGRHHHAPGQPGLHDDRSDLLEGRQPGAAAQHRISYRRRTDANGDNDTYREHHRRERHRGRRRGDRLHHHARRGRHHDGHRRLPDVGRHGRGRRRLHRQERHPDLLRRRNEQDDLGRDRGRHRERERRDLHRHALEPLGRRPRHQLGHRHDREPLRGPADGPLREHAVRARRLRVHLRAPLLREPGGALPTLARPLVQPRTGRRHQGPAPEPAGGQQEPELDDYRRAPGHGADRHHAARRGQLHRRQVDLHRRRPEAEPLDLGDSRRTPVDLGRRRDGHRGRRRGPRLHGVAQPQLRQQRLRRLRQPPTARPRPAPTTPQRAGRSPSAPAAPRRASTCPCSTMRTTTTRR